MENIGPFFVFIMGHILIWGTKDSLSVMSEDISDNAHNYSTSIDISTPILIPLKSF